MLQLNLNFLERQIARFRPPPSRPVAPDSPWVWKHGITVHLIRQPRARRYLLRLLPDGSARLVIPRRGNLAEGLRFLERSEAWLLQQRARWQSQTQVRLPWTEGTRFLFRGEEVVLQVESADSGVKLNFADEYLILPQARPDYREAIFGHLRRLAERELPVRTRELASQHGVTIHRVTVRAQKTRWGSCSSRGTISLNWRLAQAPSHVVDYLIIHELMHRQQMNHSARFWKLIAEAFPDYRIAEQWLKEHRLEKLA
jgi:predicted metal-dependent hydrolase